MGSKIVYECESCKRRVDSLASNVGWIGIEGVIRLTDGFERVRHIKAEGSPQLVFCGHYCLTKFLTPAPIPSATEVAKQVDAYVNEGQDIAKQIVKNVEEQKKAFVCSCRGRRICNCALCRRKRMDNL